MKPNAFSDYQVLLNHGSHRGLVVSCYADTSVHDGFSRHWSQTLETEARRIREQLVDRPEALAEFDRAIEAIHGAIEAPEARQARGMAIFAGKTWDPPFVVTAPIAFESRLVVDDQPYVVPLLAAHLGRGRYLVIHVDGQRGRIYEATPGEAELLEELDDSGPKPCDGKGEVGVKQADTVARHMHEHVVHFHKKMIDLAFKAWNQGVYHGVILLGTHTAVDSLRNLMPPTGRARGAYGPAGLEGRASADRRDRARNGRERIGAGTEGSARRNRAAAC